MSEKPWGLRVNVSVGFKSINQQVLYVGGSFDQASAFIYLLEQLVAEADTEPGPGLHMHIMCEPIIGLVSSGFHLRFLQVTSVSSVMRVDGHVHVVLGGAGYRSSIMLCV